jgi:hypothetical protein
MRASRVGVVGPESPLIGIEPFDPSTHRNFVATIERVENLGPGHEADIASFSIVVTNHARGSVESLVIGWRVAGESKPRHLILDGYWNPPRKPILAPGEPFLVNPIGTLPETLPDKFVTTSLPGPYGFFPLKKVVDGNLQLEPRRDVSVEAIVDSAVFDDGTMIGPDRFGIVAFLRERQSAVKAIIERVEDGVTNGKTIDDVLSDWPVTSGRHHHAEHLVRQVRRNNSFLEFLKQMRELSPNHP